MKKYNCFSYVFGLIGAIFLIFAPLSKIEAYEEEQIKSFNVNIQIEEDTSINITEEIHYHFPTDRHGIYREIPVNYSTDSSFLRTTKFTLNDLYYYQNSDGAIKYSNYESSTENGYKVLKIGSGDVYISGDYVFVIDYTLKYANNYFDTHDEIYLDVIGDSWTVPVANVTATITAPGEITDQVCYTGAVGSEEQNCKFEKQEENTLVLKTTEKLGTYEGLTFAIKMPKGTLEDTTEEQTRRFLIANIGIFLPIPVLILGIYFLRTKGKNKKLTIIPHYESPKGINPSFAGYIYKNSLQTKYISAEIIELAVKGFIKIKQIKRNNYELTRTEKSDSKLEKEQQQLLEGLFKKGDTVSTKKIDTKFYLTVSKMKNSLLSRMKTEEMYSDQKNKLQGRFVTAGVVLIIAAFVCISMIDTIPLIGWFIGCIVSGALLLVLAGMVDRRSEKGNKAYHELEGLKMYINTAEKRRIEFHDDPDKFRGVFEALLPFAMIFNLEKKWAKEFKDIYKEPPSWYEGYNSNFNAYMLANSINTMHRSVNSKSSPPGSSSGFSSSSSGSGFSGGSSGGGFGGGGGGSW